ncbi:uncharacterized protein LOC118436506 [Folsomia candida]|uniref:uncharacterized protein LOC118436506 n=1 Tax=Folsomia candida TaxID=158441 RepID=UPI001604E621|nr:uncharacterized protein LOC118436506 [Folsomia candida]XP_035710617.1 uncharacterized protein LOC118436506 [Folsomia candida]
MEQDAFDDGTYTLSSSYLRNWCVISNRMKQVIALKFMTGYVTTRTTIVCRSHFTLEGIRGKSKLIYHCNDLLLLKIIVYLFQYRRPEPSAFTFNPDVRTSIRREVNEGGRPFLIHVEEVNYPTRRAAREGIATLEAVVIAYFSWISPHTPRNSQVGKLKYCIANKHAEVDTFMDCNPRIKSHILAMASTRSRRPFHFLLDPSVPCPIDHSYPGQPYSAMMHPNRDKITEVILDKMEEEESTDGEESDYSEMDDMFTDDDDVFEDSSYPDSSAPQTPTSFLSSVRFERQSRGHNSCGMNAVNNFNQDGPVYTRDFFQDIAANLEEAERDVVDTGELDKGAYGGDIGDYSVEVLERALVFAHYQVSRQSDEFDIDSSLGFIYNPGNHWIAVRRVEDQWVEMDSMAAAPTIVTPLDVLKLVRQYGNAVIIVTGKNGQTDP